MQPTQPTETNWSGQAELVDVNGLLIAQVAAELWKRSVDGRGVQWGGLIACPPTQQRLPSAEYTYTLRLVGPDDSLPPADPAPEGAVVPHGSVRLSLSAEPAVEQMRVMGQGAAPF